MLWVPFRSIFQDGIVSQGIYLSWGILLSLAINLGSWGRLGISSELRQRWCIHLTLCRAGRWLCSLGITVEQSDPLCFHTPSESWLCSTVDFLYLSYKPHPDSSPTGLQWVDEETMKLPAFPQQLSWELELFLTLRPALLGSWEAPVSLSSNLKVVLPP